MPLGRETKGDSTVTKESTQADLPARAIPVGERAARRTILTTILQKWGRVDADVEKWVVGSPLVEVLLTRE